MMINKMKRVAEKYLRNNIYKEEFVKKILQYDGRQQEAKGVSID